MRPAAGRGADAFRTLAGGAVAAVALLGGCAPAAPGPAAPPAAGLAAAASRLPEVAAGFRRGEPRPAAAGRGAVEGIEVAYSAAGDRSTAVATVELLSEGAPAEAALDAALAEALRAGPAREMREAGRFALVPPTAPGLPLSCAETAGRYGRERVVGLVCAGRSGGALVRISVTMPARQPPPADPRAFAEAIAAGLADGAPRRG